MVSTIGHNTIVALQLPVLYLHSLPGMTSEIPVTSFRRPEPHPLRLILQQSEESGSGLPLGLPSTTTESSQCLQVDGITMLQRPFVFNGSSSEITS
jgi:hypothetical protein